MKRAMLPTDVAVHHLPEGILHQYQCHAICCGSVVICASKIAHVSANYGAVRNMSGLRGCRFAEVLEIIRLTSLLLRPRQVVLGACGTRSSIAGSSIWVLQLGTPHT
eukprot:jgi/Chrzof1/1882/Cz10g24230.t1